MFCSLYKSEKYSDFTITCGFYSAKVHKAIVSAQSDYFDVACGQGWEVSYLLAMTRGQRVRGLDD